ncbi:non-ribosomal peptide synthase domain TIGR01720/amino acid adenylation domain-containing protein [Paenibacillus sp. CF095]|uniref:non-ribosomal peptide synthetase n=1 Tax=Paenibacillus sp. CF095 TaxID=1881033 RepID=UPI00088CD5AD|nr:non-ribosomal peptide synthetase [Paenibacillus sp. CF095]SDD50918.1 non-ribosomal peptide synthase domain TIGR01720/amino acid adenylation domain-containing protein [Paenibacillus sp. CF095]
MKDTTTFLFEQISKGKVERHTGVELLARMKQNEKHEADDIAVIGMGVKLPKASDLNQLWHSLKHGIDAIGPFPDARRRDIDRYLEHINQLTSETRYLDGGYLEDIDKFDYKFFRLTPKEASLMSPAQRLFLETAWATFEEAGYGGRKISGSQTGVYLGYSSDSLFDYVRFIQDVDPSALSMAVAGNLGPIVASRLSHLLDLRGPAITIDTTCSSSLVALHTACQAIHNGECEQALVGGIRINYMRLANQINIGIQSSDGRTRSFDDLSDGTGSGEGVIAVFLKPLGKATRDGDQIHAVIKGSAINQDGNSLGLTAPNARAQEEVILKAWDTAKVDPESISYIEAHGTGTKLGDPIEISAIRQAFQRRTNKKQFVGIGSVKSNFGHLDNAAGLLGLVKTILSLKNRELPATLHFQKGNEQISFEDSPAYLIDRLTTWKAESYPLRAGVSSFGLSGTNCHVILEEARESEPSATGRLGGDLLPLSAKNTVLLRRMVEQYVIHLQDHPHLSLADVCYTAGTGRGHHSCRLAIHANNIHELQNKLKRVLNMWPSCHFPSEGIYYGEGSLSGTDEDDQSVLNLVEGLRNLTDQDEEFERTQLLEKLGYSYTKFMNIPWEELYIDERRRKVSLPTYPFERSRCWISISNGQNTRKELIPAMDVMYKTNVTQHREEKLSFIKQVLEKVSGIPYEDIHNDHNFFEIGLDSILLFQVSERMKDRYGVDVSLSSFYGELSTPKALASYLADHVPMPQNTSIQSFENQIAYPEVLGSVTSPTGELSNLDLMLSNNNVKSVSSSGSEMEKLVSRQLDIMQQQLELLRNGSNMASETVSLETSRQAANQSDMVIQPDSSSEILITEKTNATTLTRQESNVFLPYRKLNLSLPSNLTDQQINHVNALSDRLNERFKVTKELTQKYRQVLANNRNVAGFRPSWKEMTFQLIAKSAQGSRIWDMDDNEYLDISMGFGAYLLGHAPSFITDAISKELSNGMPIGPMNLLAGEVAEQIAHFTGSERVAFYNSGTEAVMVALRLARAVTGRSKIALFEGAFHGTFDGVLARRHTDRQEGFSVPMAPGITENLVGDVLVLKYNDPESLEIIDRFGHELAAILVEPVQSRRPDLQPRQFLHDLRSITEKHATALIFDEVITGFRIGQGGAQEWFGVQADIATYGKVIGAGMPVGIVAGKAKFLNAIDGGWWQFGDESYPISDHTRTLVGGTFCHHPLTMASILAMLTHLREQGPGLQENLNALTRRLVETLNEYFIEQQIPISMVHFGSLFRFVLQGDSELLFYHLLEKGIYVWEGRNCFLSTAHTEKDVDWIIHAVMESVEEMRSGGFLPPPSPGPGRVTAQEVVHPDLQGEAVIPMTENQQSLWLLTRASKHSSIAHSDCVLLELNGPLNLNAMEKAMDRVVNRHRILRTVKIDEQGMHPDQKFSVNIPVVDFSCKSEVEQFSRIEDWLKDNAERPFEIGLEPLFRLYMLKIGAMRNIFVVMIHHLVADGWSASVMLQELEVLYSAECRGESFELPPSVQFNRYVEWQHNKQTSSESSSAIQYWLRQYECLEPYLALPMDYPPPPVKSYNGARERLWLDEALTKQLKSLSRGNGSSLFITLFGSFQLLLHRLAGQNRFLIGIPVAGQSDMGVSSLVGQCARTLLLPVEVIPNMTFIEHIDSVKKSFSEGMRHRYYRQLDLVKAMSERGLQMETEIQALFNLDKEVSLPQFANLTTKLLEYPIRHAKQDLSLNVVDVNGKLMLDFDYNADLFSSETVKRWTQQFFSLLENIVVDPEVKLTDVSLQLSDQQEHKKQISDPSLMSDSIEQYSHSLVRAFDLKPEHIIVLDDRLQETDLNALSLAGRLQGAQVRIENNIMPDLSNREVIIFISDTLWLEIVRESKTWIAEEEIDIRAGCAVISDKPILAAHVDRYLLESDNQATLRFGFRLKGASSISSVFDVGELMYSQPHHMIPIGRPLENTDLITLDSSMQLAPLGVYGELYVRAPWITSEDNVGDIHSLVPTGTIGRLLPNGMLEQVGLREDLILLNGRYVNPSYIKAVIFLIPEVKDVEVIGIHHVGKKPLTAAYIMLHPEGDISIEQIRKSLKKWLPDFMIPTRIRVIDRLPKTENDIDKQALINLELEQDEMVLDTAVRGRLNATQQKLLHIWRDILGIEEITLKDNFFELGGQSFKAMQLMFMIQKEWFISISFPDIFSSKSLEELSQHIDQAKQGNRSIIPRAKNKTVYPLSSAQRRQFALHQIDPLSTAYNISVSFVLEGSMDIARLKEAFQKLAMRHESLRTSFALVNGEGVQVVHERACVQVDIDDVNSSDNEFVQPFDLGEAPLLRVRIRKESESKYSINLDSHHIIMDGISMNVLFRDLVAFYLGNEGLLPKLDIQYKDYSEWQIEQLDGEEIQTSERYWLELYNDIPPKLQLPTDYTRPTIKSFEGASISFEFNKDLLQELNKLARRSDATIFQVLLAAYKVFLVKYTGQQDIVVGTPVSGRQNIETENIIGMFVNTLPLRTSITTDQTFMEFVQRVKDSTMTALKHQEYPLDLLIDKLDLERDPSRNPLFDAVFAFENTEELSHGEAIDGIKIIPVRQDSSASQFDLVLQVQQDSNTFRLKLEYDSKLFNKDTVFRMIQHFKNIIKQAILHPDTRLSELDLISDDEKLQIMQVFNGNEAEYRKDATVHQLFEEQAARTPDRTAVIYGEDRLTYRELNEQANRLARVLLERGVKPDDLIGIMVERSFEMLVGILAIMKAGGAYVPLDPTYPKERIQYIMEDTKLSLLLVQEPLLSVASSVQSHKSETEIIILSEKTWLMQDGSNLPSQSDSSNLVYVIYTSGSTGRPKGVLVEHRSVVNYLTSLQARYTLKETDILLLKNSLNFDASVWELYWWILGGAAVVLLEQGMEKDPAELLRTIEKEKVTMVFFVPSLLHMFLNYIQEGLNDVHLPDLKRVFSGGEALSANVANRFNNLLTKQFGVRLTNCYGPTEATVESSYYNLDGAEVTGNVAIGSGIANAKLYILDQETGTRLQPIGVPGELHIGGAGLVRGYLNLPKLTEERFIDNPFIPGERMYKTGDLVRWLPNGQIEYWGRIDQQLKIRGYRIEVGEIEQQLLSHRSVREAVITVNESEIGTKDLCAYFVADEELGSREIRNYLAEHLAPYMIPTYLVQLEKLPLAPNGKLDRSALPEPAKYVEPETYSAPRNEIEQHLANAWQDVLGLQQVGIDDHFFFLGGDSIKAIQISAKLMTVGLRLQVKDLFEKPTIRTLSPLILEKSNHVDQSPVKGIGVLTPVQRWFFNQYESDLHHFNQSLLMRSGKSLDPEKVKTTFIQLIQHHDALRMIFEEKEGDWIPFNREITGEGELGFKVFDFRNVSQDKLAECINEEADNCQASLNLQSGPLCNVVLFQTANEDYLLFVIHHLVVDGISWRILIEDFQTGYIQLCQSEPINLPMKTDAYLLWAKHLKEYASMPDKMHEHIRYWSEMEQHPVVPLPVDRMVTVQTGDGMQELTHFISEENTTSLLTTVHQAYNTEINDLLLAALGLAVNEWIGHEQSWIQLEGHGREDLIQNIDISRTVGWFTSIYPVLLSTGKYSSDLASCIKSVKENLRLIPERGIGYGMLRYLSSTDITAIEPEICFNYLGQVSNEQTTDWLTMSDLSSGKTISPKHVSPYKLEINGIVKGQRLALTFRYNSDEYDKSTIQNFAEAYEQQLDLLIQECINKHDTEFTPSDFSAGGLDMEDLDDALRVIEENF